MSGMRSTARVALAALFLGGLLASGGGAAQTAPDASSDTTTAVRVVGAGATFPQPLYARWFADYQAAHPQVQVTYRGGGSGEGVRGFLAGTLDFGASDAALSDAELRRVDPRRGALMLPTTAGMVVLAYNVPGVGQGLSLTREAYTGIFAGKINSWNDPRITATNPGLALPNKAIVRVVRRDSSGTTFIFTNHLAAIDPAWATTGPGVGKLLDWPGNAMTAHGNEGVAQRVRMTEGAIGYMEYSFARRLDLPIAALQNKAGAMVMPSPEAGRAALDSAREIPADLRVFVPDPEGADAYPILGYTWILLPRHQTAPGLARTLRDLFQWGLDRGQSIAEEMGYVPLPASMRQKAMEALAVLD